MARNLFRHEVAECITYIQNIHSQSHGPVDISDALFIMIGTKKAKKKTRRAATDPLYVSMRAISNCPPCFFK